MSSLRRSSRCKVVSKAASNNGMHPTRISADVIPKIGCLVQNLRAGDAWR